MYESPIKINEDQLHNQIITDMENETMKMLMCYQIHVDKEELLKALKYDREQYEKGYQDGLNADKWIPCSERLPEEYKFVLCTEKGTRELYIGWVMDVEDVGNRWFDSEGFSMDVVAWQPLPEPYKENNND